MFAFHKIYFLLAILLFISEVVIGLDVHDAIIRPFGGDFLIVILLYYFVKSFINAPATPTAIYVLLFSYAVEVSQYFHLVNILGLQNSFIAKALLGTTFSFVDLLCYTLGIALVLILENIKLSLKKF
jgi:DNA integrity scanning protein DisA with diadenylate cyclase activity